MKNWYTVLVEYKWNREYHVMKTTYEEAWEFANEMESQHHGVIVDVYGEFDTRSDAIDFVNVGVMPVC